MQYFYEKKVIYFKFFFVYFNFIAREPNEDKEKEKLVESILRKKNRKVLLGVLFIQID